MLKSILALLLSLSLLLTLAACGKEPEVPETDSTAEITSQTQGEETALIPSEEESLVESVAEPEADPVTADLPNSAPSVTEAKVPSITESKEETASQATSVQVTASQETQDNAPEHSLWVDTVEEMLSWVRANRQRSDKELENKPILSAAKKQTSLVVPSSKRDGLVHNRVTVPESAEYYVHDFRTHVSKTNNENELYTIIVRPLSASEQKNDLRSFYLVGQEGVLTATYGGMKYAYKDGYEGTNSSDRVFSTAWFVKDGYIVKISALWVNSFKPWNPEWFDYFNFENVTL